ncbi:hypothetical protein ABVT39_022285 [Epinephelus coioides]
MYNPGPEVTVDERLVPFRGRCPFKVYIPSKPGKYGIKIWAACDARSSYAWNMQAYMGKTSTVTLLCHMFPRRIEIMMSTLHKDTAVITAEDRKPLMIQDYNRNKGGIDCLDKLTGTYTCKQMTARWPVAVFHNILDVSACNAYMVWTVIDPT